MTGQAGWLRISRDYRLSSISRDGFLDRAIGGLAGLDAPADSHADQELSSALAQVLGECKTSLPDKEKKVVELAGALEAARP